MAPLIEQHRDQIIELCRKYGITRLDVFGSAARGTDFDPATSDADFFYEIDVEAPALADRYFDFVFALEALLGREVDLVSIFETQRHRPYFFDVTKADRQVLFAA